MTTKKTERVGTDGLTATQRRSLKDINLWTVTSAGEDMLAIDWIVKHNDCEARMFVARGVEKGTLYIYSNTGHLYTVSLTTCECEDWKRHAEVGGEDYDCKHKIVAKAVAAFQAKRRAEKQAQEVAGGDTPAETVSAKGAAARKSLSDPFFTTDAEDRAAVAEKAAEEAMHERNAWLDAEADRQALEAYEYYASDLTPEQAEEAAWQEQMGAYHTFC
jgi:predicted nucleic acid-binding Zn finger protein